MSSWKTSLGTPVGVVIIGSGFAPDGKTRIISLTNMSYNGYNYIMWDAKGGYDTDSLVPNFNYVPTTDNTDSTANGNAGYGYLPSDSTSFEGIQSHVDGLTKYIDGIDNLIPSPYLGCSSNPAYYQVIEGGNALSDFNGLNNTQLLVNAGERYNAANACWNYKDQANSNLQWYLPAMGELGYLMPRFKQINESLQAVGGVPLDESDFWSSSEYFDGRNYGAWDLIASEGAVYNDAKDNNFLVRCVSLL